MNEVIRQLKERKSVRSFLDRDIAPQVLSEILDCALQAPSAGNQQLYTIIDVKNPELKQRLSVLCDNQPFIAKAPVVLVFCADCRKWYRAFEMAGAEPRAPMEGDLMLSVCDTLIAAQNAVTAAHSLGLGSCYIGDVMENCRELRACLKLPDYVFPAAMLVMGYPTEQQLARQKPGRCSLEHMVCTDCYKEPDARQLFSGEAEAGKLDEWLVAFCNRKYNSAFSREMSRSVREYLEQYRD